MPTAVNSKSSSGTAEQQLRDDMVMDLVSVLPQLLEPMSTTIQYNERESGEAATAVLQLVDQGFGLQRVDADQGKYFLRLADVTLPSDTENLETRLRLSVGAVEITRSYKKLNKLTNPELEANLKWRGDSAVIAAGPVLLAGTQSQAVIEGFELAVGASNNNGELSLTDGSIQYTAAAPIEGGIPTISLITKELVDKVAQS